MRIILRWIILTLAVMASSYVIDGIHVKDFFTALYAALFLGLLNVFFKPILLILTLPINIITLGLFTFIINAALLLIVSGVMKPDFQVDGFWAAVLGALVISAVNWMLSVMIKDGARPRAKRGGASRDDVIDLTKQHDDRWQ